MRIVIHGPSWAEIVVGFIKAFAVVLVLIPAFWVLLALALAALAALLT